MYMVSSITDICMAKPSKEPALVKKYRIFLLSQVSKLCGLVLVRWGNGLENSFKDVSKNVYNLFAIRSSISRSTENTILTVKEQV